VPRFAVILPAAGKSSRFRDAHYKKPYAPLDGRAVWLHSAERFLNRDDVQRVILVISPEDKEAFYSKFGANVAILGIEVVEGGAERAIRCKRRSSACRAMPTSSPFTTPPGRASPTSGSTEFSPPR
jgi:2-C-methyl-D-erythritol 4-phosphate cytidylyltransferase